MVESYQLYDARQNIYTRAIEKRTREHTVHDSHTKINTRMCGEGDGGRKSSDCYRVAFGLTRITSSQINLERHRAASSDSLLQCDERRAWRKRNRRWDESRLAANVKRGFRRHHFPLMYSGRAWTFRLTDGGGRGRWAPTVMTRGLPSQKAGRGRICPAISPNYAPTAYFEQTVFITETSARASNVNVFSLDNHTTPLTCMWRSCTAVLMPCMEYEVYLFK